MDGQKTVFFLGYPFVGGILIYVATNYKVNNEMYNKYEKKNNFISRNDLRIKISSIKTFLNTHPHSFSNQDSPKFEQFVPLYDPRIST